MTSIERPAITGSALRRTVLLTALASIAFAAPASAGKRDQPTHVKDLDSYSFVVKQKGDDYTMQIEHDELGVLGGRNSGYIEYRLVTWQGKDIVQINMIKGIKEIRGVGKALKAEVLSRYPKRTLTSTLIEKNRERVLKAWAKGYPHSSTERNGELLRKVVPAVQFEGFNYTLTAEPDRSGGPGGQISMEMKPARRGRKGKIIIENPVDLDKILVSTAPEYIRAKDRPKSEKELAKEAKENENAAKEVRDMLEDLAEEVSEEEGVDEKDLLAHLLDVIDDACGRGGSDGRGWAQGCLFTPKGRTFVVTPGGKGVGFYLNKTIVEEAEEFVDDNR